MPGILIANITRNSDNFDDMTDEELIDAIFQDIVDATPVDTGTLRAGWYQSGDDIGNEVEYCSYIEQGTEYISAFSMAQNALDQYQVDADIIEL
jgi:hypothetical protein